MHVVDRRFNVTGIPVDIIKLETQVSVCIDAQGEQAIQHTTGQGLR
jgi:hypothetical protein